MVNKLEMWQFTNRNILQSNVSTIHWLKANRGVVNLTLVVIDIDLALVNWFINV